MATQRRSRRRARKKRLTFSSYVIMIALLAFGVMAGLLFQHSAIADANNMIREEQKKLEAAKQVNDSKEGKLVTNMDLQSIESQARGFGMKEATQEQLRYETTVENSRESHSVTDNKKEFEISMKKLF